MRFARVLLGALSLLAALPAASQAREAYAYSGTTLHRFDTSNPGGLQAVGAITGLEPTEELIGIDFRPATGQLYGVGTASQLYLIDPATAVATPVGGEFSTLLAEGEDGDADFDPRLDRMRIVNPADQHLLVHPATGAVSREPNLAGDSNPAIEALTHTNNFPGAAETSLVAYDWDPDVVAAIDPAFGSVTPLGPSGVESELSIRNGLDTAPDGTSYALAQVGGESRLFRLDGFSYMPAGSFPVPVEGITLAPATNVFSFAATAVRGSEDGDATIRIARSGDRRGEARVGLALAGGTATPGEDFRFDPAALVRFRDGDEHRDVKLDLLDDGVTESPETIDLDLISPSGGAASVGSPSRTTVSVNDPDHTPPRITVSGLRGGVRANRANPLRLRVRLSEPADLLVSITGGRGAPRRLRGRIVVRRLPAGGLERRLTLRLPRAGLARVTRPARLLVRVRATDAAGNSRTARRPLVVSPPRRPR